ncbi:MAG: hypothetical protein J5552_00095, partial [Prevotella sp.]|nr:hypothetical protein [Prevotella sp.]
DEREPQAVHFWVFLGIEWRLAYCFKQGWGLPITDSPHSIQYASRIAALFLMELLPSRAPLCFRLHGKGTKPEDYSQTKQPKRYPAI